MQARQRKRLKDERPSAAARGYSWRWQKARATFLSRSENALCVECKRLGRIVPAIEVDHIIPHRGDQKLFWDRTNWAALCKPCHSAKTMRELNERQGKRAVRRMGCDASGMPLDPEHSWNR